MNVCVYLVLYCRIFLGDIEYGLIAENYGTWNLKNKDVSVPFELLSFLL